MSFVKILLFFIAFFAPFCVFSEEITSPEKERSIVFTHEAMCDSGGLKISFELRNNSRLPISTVESLLPWGFQGRNFRYVAFRNGLPEELNLVVPYDMPSRLTIRSGETILRKVDVTLALSEARVAAVEVLVVDFEGYVPFMVRKGANRSELNVHYSGVVVAHFGPDNQCKVVASR